MGHLTVFQIASYSLAWLGGFQLHEKARVLESYEIKILSH